MVGFFAELVVVGGSRANNGRILVWYEADRALVAAKKIFIFEGKRPTIFGGGAGGVIGEAEGNFAGGEFCKEVGKGGFEDAGRFDGAAEARKGNVVSMNEGALVAEGFYGVSRKK